jgi:hypothetical protein
VRFVMVEKTETTASTETTANIEAPAPAPAPAPVPVYANYKNLGEGGKSAFEKVFVQKSVSLVSQLVLNSLKTCITEFDRLERTHIGTLKEGDNTVYNYLVKVKTGEDKRIILSKGFCEWLLEVYTVSLKSNQVFELSRQSGRPCEPITSVDNSGDEVYKPSIFEDEDD